MTAAARRRLIRVRRYWPEAVCLVLAVACVATGWSIGWRIP